MSPSSTSSRPASIRRLVDLPQPEGPTTEQLTSFDAAKVQGMPGVKHVVKVGDSAVAVVAERWWQAKTALDALPATWDEGENAKVSSASIAEFLKTGSTPIRPSSATSTAT